MASVINVCFGAQRTEQCVHQLPAHRQSTTEAGIMEADNRQVTIVFTVQPSFHHRHSTNRVRGAHIMFCNLDELMTSLLCILHHIIDKFCNTCDKKISLDSVQPFSFHVTKCPVRVTSLLPAVLTFREGIFEL